MKEIKDYNIDNFVSDFCSSVWKDLKNRGVIGIGVTGSYARGSYSRSRPDINFAVFVEETKTEILLGIMKVLSRLDKKYSRIFNLHPEFHPERFTFPWQRDSSKPDLFFKVAIFPLADKNLPMPFGRPGFVIEGHRISIKMFYGKNILEDVKISTNNREVISGCSYVLQQWAKAIQLTPLSYSSNRDTDLFFNESLSWGKIAIQQYAWIEGVKRGLNFSKHKDRLFIFDKIHNKEKLRGFFHIPSREQKMVNLILDARKKYSLLKNNRVMAVKIYKNAVHLLNFFLSETKIALQNLKV